ncbi:hypothetical protein GCM10010278_41060 [Streptomyces melanogenes]|nr:hypothetical protein GCM10010278_41060 [Streptomyces melanogenes]
MAAVVFARLTWEKAGKVNYVVITFTVMRPLSATSACTYNKTPRPAKWLVTGSLGTY